MHQGDPATAVVVDFSGNLGRPMLEPHVAFHYADLGRTVIAVDYVTPDERVLIDVADWILTHMDEIAKRHAPSETVLLHGRSLGGGIAIAAAGRAAAARSAA